MKNKEFKVYVSSIKDGCCVEIEDKFLEKDYILSLFLSYWAKENTPHLDALIFKGGTLLTKTYLNYHRISEDLDFIHEDSNTLRKISTKGKRETQIKERIIPIIKEIKKLADLSKLDFETDRKNTRYIIQRNSRSLYLFNLYYKSQIDRVEGKIKLEISFVEDFINNPRRGELNNITDFIIKDFDTFKTLTNYSLEKPQLQIYPIEEIILEKIRACITREQFKARDVFDLYLINKETNIFEQKKEDIFRKLRASPFEVEDIIRNIKHFIEEEISVDIEEIYDLSLIEFDEEDFIAFTNKLIKYLKEIAKEFKF